VLFHFLRGLRSKITNGRTITKKHSTWRPTDCSITNHRSHINFAPHGTQSTAISCSVCLSTHVSQKPHVKTSPNFLYKLRVALAQTSEDNAISYAFLVLQMMSHNGTNADTGHWQVIHRNSPGMSVCYTPGRDCVLLIFNDSLAPLILTLVIHPVENKRVVTYGVVVFFLGVWNIVVCWVTEGTSKATTDAESSLQPRRVPSLLSCF